jgi:replicative DNA helicase
MIVALQILCKCLSSGNIDIIEDNNLTEEYFSGYEEERNFIVNHYKEFGNTPDNATFLSKFPDIDLVEVTESDRYLIETIREEYLFSKSVPIVQKIAKLLETDANSAVEYMIQATKELQPNYNLGGTDIIADAIKRYNEFVERKEQQDKWFFTTGFEELDDVIHGIQRVEEFFVIFARTNQGKSWVLEKILTHIWEIGFNVGYISPEMGASSIGYRFDTLHNHIDNKALMWGKEEVSNDDYKKYIDELSQRKNKFIVATPNDFDRRITISKLRNWIKQYNLDAIAIDGITYLSDERGNKRDNKTTSLTNISEDLMSLSIEMKIPILTVVQANRGGVVDNDTDDLPELESIRDSDGISFNATKVISLKQNKDGDLLLQIKKQRNGIVGKKLAYKWNANIGEFVNTPILSKEEREERKEQKRERKERKQTAKEDVF